MVEGAIDVHCHIDLEFTAKERKREPEFQWLPKADAMGMRGVVLKSHWWPTVNVVPYMLASVDTKISLWSSVALNITAGGPNPCVVEACAELGGKMVFLPTWSARNDVERKGFSSRMQSIYKNGVTLGMGHVSWQESMAFIEAAHQMNFNRIVINHAQNFVIGAPLDALKRAGDLGAF